MEGIIPMYPIFNFPQKISATPISNSIPYKTHFNTLLEIKNADPSYLVLWEIKNTPKNVDLFAPEPKLILRALLEWMQTESPIWIRKQFKSMP
jgi:hypothetical protein